MEKSKLVLIFKFSIFVIFLTVVSCSFGSKIFYVDSFNGDDTNRGTTPDKSWKTLEKVNASTFSPGDHIYFKSDGIWSGQLWPKGSGKAGEPIVIDKYGDGNLPIINGEGKVINTVYLYNQEYWEIKNLEITNFSQGDTSLKRGIYIKAKDLGVVHHLYMQNLKIHDVNGDMSTRDGGGIFMEIAGNKIPTWFDDILVENCEIYDVDRIGFNNISTWMFRTLTKNTNWYPSLNVKIRNNYFERTGGNALIVRVSDRPLFEHNIFKNCGVKGTGNSNYPFNCDNALIQYNEAYLTHYTKGTPDGGGFNSDWRCKNTIIQYNYSHDNDHGGQLICNNGGIATSFNDGTIIRYNVYQNNKHHVFRVAGTPTNTSVYNNTIYIGPDQSSVIIIWHKDWGGDSDGVTYYNNIIYNKSPSSYYDFGKSTNYLFDYNIFSGIRAPGEPKDSHKITDDPLFVIPGSGDIGWDTIKGYMLKSGSAAINSGFKLHNHPSKDYLGNPVPFDNGMIDRGAFEFQGNSQL